MIRNSCLFNIISILILFFFLFILVYCTVGTNHFNSKGVGYRKKNHSVRVIYLSQKRRIGVGVRDDNIRYVVESERTNILKYRFPCVCGSLTHTSTKSPKCLLNDQYNDAKENKEN